MHDYDHSRIGRFVVEQPLVLGHEASGDVVEVGPGVTGLQPGQRVSLEPGVPDLVCEQCLAGRYDLCPQMRLFATPPVDGAFAELVAVSAAFAHPAAGARPRRDRGRRRPRQRARPAPAARRPAGVLRLPAAHRRGHPARSAGPGGPSGRVDLDRLVTGTSDLADAALALTASRRGDTVVKAVVRPGRRRGGSALPPACPASGQAA